MDTSEQPVRPKRTNRSVATTYTVIGQAEWIKLMAESLKGVPDKELSDKYGVTCNTICQRRTNDNAWRIAHERLKDAALIKSKETVNSVQTSPLSIAEIAALNPELIAKFTYEALKCSIEQGMIPLPTSWSEAKTAMDMMRKATGQDDKTTNVNIALWSGSSVSPAPSVATIHEAEIVSQKEPEDWV